MIKRENLPLPKWPEIIWISFKKQSSLRILGINPWIYDFAAYNFWARPIGLISCLSMLMQVGCEVALLDCMYPMWKGIPWPKIGRFGLGAYPREEIPKPFTLQNVPRKFARYGLPFELVEGALKRMDPPDFVLLSCVMTYWYPGLIFMINLIRKIFSKTKIIVGGIYPTLCPEHAEENLDADLIIKGSLEEKANWQKFTNFIGISSTVPEFRVFPIFYRNPRFSIILGSRGCPFSCEYCASKALYQGFTQRPIELIFEEFMFDYKRGVQDFAFYDDALLFQPASWFVPFLKKIIENKFKVRFHTPNGLHVKYLKKDICMLMKKAGFKTIRLGLETQNFSSRLDRKLTKAQWDEGIKNLLEAGFDRRDIGVYILFGLPNQEEEEIIRTIEFAKSYGFRPHLAYYTPIPGSKLFEKAKYVCNYPISEDPIYQNNAIWPCYKKGFSWEERAKWRKFIYT